jgi:hypothetical protein
VKIKFWFWFIYLIQFVLQVQRVRIFHNFSLVEWENSFVPANPHRTSRLSSSRAVGHVGVIFFSCGCFYLKVSCPLRSRCRQHITFRGDDDDDDDGVHFSLTANSPSDIFLFFVFGCKMSTDTNFIISQPLESDPILSRLFNPRPRLMCLCSSRSRNIVQHVVHIIRRSPLASRTSIISWGTREDLSAVPFWHWPINDAKVTDMSQNNLSSSKTCARPSLALEITCIVYYLGDYYETKGDE